MSIRNKIALLIGIPVFLEVTGLLVVVFKCTQPMTGSLALAILLFILGFCCLAAVVGWALKKGVHNAVMMESVEVEFKEMEKQEKIDALYKPSGEKERDENWLRGFAASLDFFANNYLSKQSYGPTEKFYWEGAITASQKNVTSEDLERGYREYMIYSLMYRNGISEADYNRLVDMVDSQGVHDLLCGTIYNKGFRKPVEKDIEKDLKPVFDNYNGNERKQNA